MRAILKNPATGVVLFLAVVLGASFIYLGDHVNGQGRWIIAAPGEIKLIGVDGTHLTVRGDFPVDSKGTAALGTWLESNGFSRDQTDGAPSGKMVYRGEYEGSLPVTVTIEAAPPSGPATISLS